MYLIMCGIAGFLDFNRSSTQNELEKMTDSMSHRGPDGSGYLLRNSENFQLGFGHRRLAIIDLTDLGKQPMHFNGLDLVFNGEIYNFKEIKQELISLDHTFEGSSDTEMILHAYQTWGEECIHKFIGMFAFVIFDIKKQSLFCARDRAGVKPLFYFWKDGLFLFSSELKAFHQHSGFKKSINLDAVASYMQFGNVPGEHCIFENCYKLKPGHWLKINLITKQIETKSYWNINTVYSQKIIDISFNEAKIETEKLLKSACEYRMIADVPVGVFLSGGYDSTCVTALLQKDRTEKLKTFTIGVPDLGMNEAPYAKEIAKKLGTEHHEFVCSQKEAIEIIPTLPFYFDEPFGDSSAIPTILVSRMARKQVTVALSADGGDELFAGYNRYDYLLRYGKKINATPKVIRYVLAKSMKAIPASKIPFFNTKYNFANRYDKLQSLLKDCSSETMMMSMLSQFDTIEIQNLMAHNVTTVPSVFTKINKANSNLNTMLSIDYQSYLPDDILQKVDRATMSASLEGREPFLDHRIVEFTAQLPDHFKYNNGSKKFILKEITHKYVSKKLLDRPKMGFGIPIENWMMKELKAIVIDFTSEEKIKKQGIFNPNEIEKMRTQFFSGRKELGYKMWYLLMFQMWYDQWMEPNSNTNA
jgi:asparagine synthase (glutamine-hydrolysing)